MWIVGKKLRSHPKPQIQDAELRRRRLGIRTIPYIFGEEGRIKRLRCVFFFCVFMCKNVFGREEKCVESIQVESKTQKIPSFFGLQVPGAFYGPNKLYKAATLRPFIGLKGHHLQMVSG